MAWYVYIIQSRTGRLYTGVTTDPQRRLREHNESPRGAKCTRAGRPWRLLWVEPVPTRGQALRREAQIKRLPRSKKLLLCR